MNTAREQQGTVRTTQYGKQVMLNGLSCEPFGIASCHISREKHSCSRYIWHNF